MDYRQLQFLVALSKERHFGRAAHSCQVTQPTLSARIKQLEEELGCSLIERSRSFKHFTLEGERVLEHAWRILEECNALRLVGTGHESSHSVATAPPQLQRLELGVVSSALAEAVSLPGLKSSGFSLRLREYEMPALLQALVDDDIDIGIGYLDSGLVLSEEYRVLPLFNERLMIFAASSLVALPRQPSWHDIEALPLGCLAKGSRLQRSVEALLNRHQVSPGMRFEADSVMALSMLVAQGVGIAILPQGYEPLLSGVGLVSHALPDADMEAPRIGMIWRRDEQLHMYPSRLLQDSQAASMDAH